MKKVLLGWNRIYGFRSYEVDIPYGCTIEEVKECKEKETPSYKFSIIEIPKEMSVDDYLDDLYSEA